MKLYLKLILPLVFAFALIAGSTSLALAADPVVTPAEAQTNDVLEHAENHVQETHQAEDTGVVGMFGLDWKLFLAQLINFAIVLFVLWKWVFGPIAKGLSDRADKIDESLREAERIANDRQNFDSWKQEEIGKVRSEAAAIISEAKQSAEELKQQTLADTKSENSKLKAQAAKELQQQQEQAIASVQAHIADLVTAASEQILREKLDSKKNTQLISQAIDKAKGSL